MESDGKDKSLSREGFKLVGGSCLLRATSWGCVCEKSGWIPCAGSRNGRASRIVLHIGATICEK